MIGVPRNNNAQGDDSVPVRFVPTIVPHCILVHTVPGYLLIPIRLNMMPPVDWYVQSIPWFHNCLKRPNVAKLWKSLEIWIIKIHLGMAIVGMADRIRIEV